MQRDDNESPAKCSKKSGAAVNRTRDRTDARMTMSTASNAVLRASERLCPIRIMIRVARKTMMPRSDI